MVVTAFIHPIHPPQGCCSLMSASEQYMPRLEPHFGGLGAARRHFSLQYDGLDASVISPPLYRINVSVCRGGEFFPPWRISITGFVQMPGTMLATYTRTQVTTPSN